MRPKRRNVSPFLKIHHRSHETPERGPSPPLFSERARGDLGDDPGACSAKRPKHTARGSTAMARWLLGSRRAGCRRPLGAIAGRPAATRPCGHRMETLQPRAPAGGRITRVRSAGVAPDRSAPRLVSRAFRGHLPSMRRNLCHLVAKGGEADLVNEDHGARQRKLSAGSLMFRRRSAPAAGCEKPRKAYWRSADPS